VCLSVVFDLCCQLKASVRAIPFSRRVLLSAVRLNVIVKTLNEKALAH